MKSLGDCRQDLRSIIRDLRDIEWDVKQGGTLGIGEGLCGDCIERIAGKYDEVLERVDTNRLADWIMGSSSDQ